MVTKLIRGAHSYTVPEVIALPIVGGSSDYLEWVKKSTRHTEKEGGKTIDANDILKWTAFFLGLELIACGLIKLYLYMQ